MSPHANKLQLFKKVHRWFVQCSDQACRESTESESAEPSINWLGTFSLHFCQRKLSKKILEVKTVLVFPLSFSSVCLSIFCQNISHWLPGACTRLALGAVYNTILGKLVIYCNGRKSKSKGNSISKILLFYMFRVTSVTLPVAVGQQISRHHPSERTLGPSRGNIGWSPDMGPRCPTSLNRLSTRI